MPAGGANNGLAVVARIPHQPEARRDQILVVGNRGREREAIGGDGRGVVVRQEGHLVAEPRADRQARTDAPLVLNVEGDLLDRGVERTGAGELAVSNGRRAR